MSTALPIVQPSPDLIEQLLREQQSLTAVEQFSALHESGELEHGPAQAKYYQKLLPATPPGPGQQFAFEVDLDQCSGCKACVVACHTMNGLEDEESWRSVGTVTMDSHQGSGEARIQHVTTACHHCENPGCLNGCPVKAYDKDPVTGIVRHLDDQCIGCKYCTMMCPYEVPKYSERLGIVRKCDMCHQRLSAGEAPACVQSCPNEAIKIRIVDQGTVFGSTDSLAAGAPLSTITRPSTKYQSEQSVAFNAASPQDDATDPVAESHWPLAVMLVATQVSVGILLIERIAATIGLLLGVEVSLLTTQLAATIAFGIAAVGMGIAPKHLGQPMRAWRVFLGLRTSWLSREAVVLGKYMGALGAAVGLLWLPHVAGYLPTSIVENVPAWAAKATLGIALLLGIAGLVSSAMIYVATKRHVWRMSRTMSRFLGSAVVGGAAWALATQLIGNGSNFAFVFLVAISAAIAKLVWESTVFFTNHQLADSYEERSRKLLLGPLSRTTALRKRLGVLGIGLLLTAGACMLASTVVAGAIAVLAAAVITLGEGVERVLYFQSVVHDRMPGTLK